MALNRPQSPDKILAELQSIRDLLDEKYFEPPLQPHLINPEAIPLLSEVVELSELPPAPLSAPSLQERLIPALESNIQGSVPILDAPLQQEAEQIVQSVIEHFLPQIEAELKRRLEALITAS